MLTRKLIRIGSSAGVIIPKEALKERKIHIGEMIDFDFEPHTDRPVHMETIDPEVIQWTKAFIERYRPALKKLMNL
jgi:antitoxin component of MazEF toxin-antitoxin module